MVFPLERPSVPSREYHITPDCTRLCIDNFFVWVHRESIVVPIRRGERLLRRIARITGIDGIELGQPYERDGERYVQLQVGYPRELPWEHVMTIVKNATVEREGQVVKRFPGPYVTY